VTRPLSRYVAPVRDYYEELWERLPDELQAPDFRVRAAFARARVHSGDRVLDLGCGQGDLTEVLAETGAHPLGVEVAEAAVRRARRRHPQLRFELAPIDGPLPLQDTTFDVVWASEVIEHVADTARWLSEVRRVLVPGGRLLVTTPNHARVPLALHGVQRYSEPLGDHLHLYSAGSLRTVLEEFDFTHIKIARRDGPPLLRRLLMARAVR
jgi:2-polyprenyl-3-methyl-5-hydroxy-6-metoxy-1,4-benzoquinol methylase